MFYNDIINMAVKVFSVARVRSQVLSIAFDMSDYYALHFSIVQYPTRVP